MCSLLFPYYSGDSLLLDLMQSLLIRVREGIYNIIYNTVRSALPQRWRCNSVRRWKSSRYA